MKSNTRMYSKLVLEPGCSIGEHTHENEEELFFVLTGTAETLDNGKTEVLNPGDASICRGGLRSERSRRGRSRRWKCSPSSLNTERTCRIFKY